MQPSVRLAIEMVAVKFAPLHKSQGNSFFTNDVLDYAKTFRYKYTNYAVSTLLNIKWNNIYLVKSFKPSLAENHMDM